MATSASNAQKRGNSVRAGRFVVLEHDHPFLHWDLMLERESGLRTWRLLARPDESREVRAEPLPDHRLHYLDYEGPLSGDRGTVKRWDFGNYSEFETSESQCRCRLQGNKLQGRIELQAPAPDGDWVLRYSPVSSDRSG